MSPDVADRSARDDAVYQQYLEFGSLVKGGRVVPKWLPDGSSFWYAEGAPNERRIVKIDPSSGARIAFFDLPRLRAALRRALGHEPDGSGVPFHDFQLVGSDRARFTLEGASFELDLLTYALRKLPAPSTYSTALTRSEAERAVPRFFMRETFFGLGRLPAHEVMSPDGRWIATIDAENLVLRATVDGQEVKITADGTPEAFWDIEGVLWNPWSPDSQHVAAFKQHIDCMARVPVIEWLKPLERTREVVTIPAGGVLHRSELHLVDAFSHQVTSIDLGDTSNEYLRVLSWTPDGSELFLARYDRLFSRVHIVTVNAMTRTVRLLLTERSNTFLTNHHEAIWGRNTGFTLLPDASGFIWHSERSGWDHLYLYDMAGSLVRDLTRGAWRVQDVVRIDLEAGWVYFTGHDDANRPYDTHFYRVSLDGQGLTRLTHGKGQHSVCLSPSGKCFTDTHSAVDVAPRTELRRADGSLIAVLDEADIGLLEEVGWVAPKEYVVKAADGVTDLWATMYFPYDFDPARKYPVLEHIYAGPQCAWRPTDFGDRADFAGLHRQFNFRRALAHLGFLVVMIDARGTPGRSKAFHDVVYRNWGQFEIADHAAALRELASRLPFIDLEQVGVWGASWGGHFAFRAMAQAPDLYRAAICEVPAFDPRRIMLYETYLGLPKENKAGYDAADVLALAPMLRGELLLIGGTNDPTTQADVFKMSEALIRLGKHHHMTLYPNSGHGAAGRTAEYDMELRKRFFMQAFVPQAQVRTHG